MSIALQKVYWRLLRVMNLRQRSWDLQFQAGMWCRGPRCPHTVEKAFALCGGGYLVEFGCGEGTLPLALPKDAFSNYRGYDISGVAVARAAEHARRAGLANCLFEQGDMARWPGDTGVSLIVLEECLYYLSPVDAVKFLQNCMKSLLPGGAILAVIHDAAKHAATIETCKQTCSVREESSQGGRLFLVLAKPGT